MSVRRALVLLMLILLPVPARAAVQQIVFSWSSGSPGGFAHIWKMGVDRSGLTQLTNASASDTAPDWQPHGTAVLFVRGGNTLFKVNNDGTGIAQVSPSGDIDSTHGDPFGSWTPDGTKVLFLHQTAHTGPPVTFSGAIMTMNPDGTNQSTILADDGTHIQDEPRMSPDGTKLVYGGNVSTPVENIFICSVSNCSGTQARITGFGGAGGSPAWWPDGSKIVIECADPTLTSGNVEICTLPSNAALGGFPGNVTLLTAFTEPGQDPNEATVSTDGAALIFSLGNCTGSSLGTGCYGGGDPAVPALIYTLSLAGTFPNNVTNLLQSCGAAGGSPRFQPLAPAAQPNQVGHF